MSRLTRLVGAIVLAGPLLGACGEPESGNAGSAEHASERAVDAIDFGEALAQIRAHHLVSLQLYEAGDGDGAALHAGHPVDEILASVGSELEEHDPELGDELAAGLQDGLTAVAKGRPVDQVATTYEEVAGLTEEALTAVVGETAEESSYRGSVVSALLATAANEYEEAVAGNKVRLLLEYQDGYAFVREARRMYQDIAADVEAASEAEAAEIEEAFETLKAALPSPQPRAQLADKLEVESTAELIAHELEGTVDAELVEESDPAEVVENIENLLIEIKRDIRSR